MKNNPRKHKSQKISLLKSNIPLTQYKRKHNSQEIKTNIFVQINAKELVLSIIQQLIDSAQQKYNQDNFCLLKFMQESLNATNMIFSTCQSMDFLSKPDTIQLSQPQNQPTFHVDKKFAMAKLAMSRAMATSNLSMPQNQIQNNYTSQNYQKDMISKLKKQHMSKSKIGKQNIQAIKLDIQGKDQEKDIHDDTNMRNLKKYTQKNLKINGLIGNNIYFQGKLLSKDEDYAFDCDGKPIKIKKNQFIQTKRHQKNKNKIIKMDVCPLIWAETEGKTQNLIINKRNSITLHSDYNKKSFMSNSLPTVQHLKSCLNYSIPLRKGARLTENFTPRQAKNDSIYLKRQTSIRKSCDKFEKLPRISSQKKRND